MRTTFPPSPERTAARRQPYRIHCIAPGRTTTPPFPPSRTLPGANRLGWYAVARSGAGRAARTSAGIAVRIGARVSALAGPERRAGVEHATRLGDWFGAGIRRPRFVRTEGCARGVAPVRRRLYLASGQNGGGLFRSAMRSAA